MRLVETFINTPLAGAVGWTLVHSLWEGAILSSTLAASLLGVRSARVRYAAACITMLVMLGAFGFTLVRMFPESTHSPTFLAPAIPAGEFRAAGDSPWNWELALAAVVPWLTPFWIAGVLAFYLRQVAGFAAVHKLRRQGVCCAPERWQRELDRFSARLRVSRPVLLLESCLAETPIVLGHFRPVILMPIELLVRLPAGQIEAILLHELAHVRRHDYLVNMLQRVVEGLLFFHPAVWWMARVVRAERENCCDDVVVSVLGDAHEYALALTALEQNRESGREPAIAATGGSLVKRIRRLLYPKGSNSAGMPILAAIILIAVLSVTLGAWQAAQPNGSPAALSQSGDTAVAPYSNWLNQEVVYIIDDAERTHRPR
jgi:beta-lactamase regulating signal transducer with metallopeptidase domain